MKATLWLVAIILLLFTANCSNDGLGPNGAGIEGTWRLYEIGSSPGYGYIVDTIPTNPLQSLTFTKRGGVRRQGDKLNGFFESPYYRVEAAQNGFRIQFLASKNKISNNYMGLVLTRDTMRVNPVCFEGCHFSFVRIR